MEDLRRRALRTMARLVGLPPRTGEILDGPTRRRLALSGLGGVVLASLELVGVLSLLPLLQLMAGSTSGGALTVARRWLDDPSDQTLLRLFAGVTVLVFVLKDIAAFFFKRWQLAFMARQEVNLSVRMLKNYLRGPYEWSLERNTGDKVFLVEGAVSGGFTSGITSTLGVFSEGITILVIIAAMTTVSPLVTVITVAFFAIGALAIQRSVRPRVARAGSAATQASLKTSSLAIEALSATKEVKLRGAEDVFTSDYLAYRDIGANARALSAILGEVPKYVLEILFILAIAVVSGIASVTQTGPNILVTLGVFVASGTRIIPSAVRLMASLNGVRFARAPLASLLSDLARYEAAIRAAESNQTTDDVVGGTLTVRDLHFSYEQQPDNPVLQGINLDVPEGSTMALVGTSGAGKTTLVDLMLGLLTPTSGVIAVNGVDIASNLRAWQRQVAVVPQDVFLLDADLARNIAFDQDVDFERLSAAIRGAQLDDVVAALPEGVDTEVGERGARLSGGQRQRLGIARALYRQPRFLFLDEATSALDNETERRLTSTLESLSRDITVIVVAHRLSTVKNADRLAFLEEGRVVAQGTFEEVQQLSPTFSRLVALGTLTPLEKSASTHG